MAVALARALRASAASGELWLPVRGGSMGRSLRSGSTVRVVPGARPRRGEVWAFCTAGGTILVHRYRRAAGGEFIFRGDARAADDAAVPASRLVGRVVEVQRDGRRRRLGIGDRVVGLAVRAARRKRHFVTTV